jgi:6-phosphofructokinase 1
VNTALEAIDKIRDTATSLERIFIVEVMGRESGFIALHVGLAGGAEDIVIPEINYDITKMCNDIKSGHKKGKLSWIIIVAEGMAEAKDIARKITNKTKLETRVVVLGHIQRGGTPTAFDRILALRLSAFAVESLIKGETDKAVGIVRNEIKLVDLSFACKKKKSDTRLYKLIQILT